jgi:PA domain
MKRYLPLLLLAAVICSLSSPLMAAATITIVNNNAAGVGFNDPTPAMPVGGNSGTTLGQQRLISFQEAARLWSLTLNSDVEIRIDASFTSLPCTASGATLGQTSTNRYLANFSGAPKSNTWYPISLANALAHQDLGSGISVMTITFTTYETMGCPFAWYYGLDGNHGSDKEDLVVTALHEFAHGFGFAGPTNPQTGRLLTSTSGSSFPGIWDHFTVDTATGLLWKDETTAQRLTSVTSGKIVWNGTLAVNASKTYLKDVATLPPVPQLLVGGLRLNLGTAEFGPQLSAATLTGSLLGATNAATAPATSTTDACAAFTNAAQMVGKIAVVDRGNCNFTVKAKNAQLAGAIAAIVVGNASDCAVFNLGGADSSVTIPAVSVTTQDGAALRALMAQGTQTASFGVLARGGNLAGADTVGNLLLYSPCTLSAGSSVYHFDTSATPNLLMEPNISSDLQHKPDLTIEQLKEIGWTSSATTTNPGSGDPVKTVGRKNIKKHH